MQNSKTTYAILYTYTYDILNNANVKNTTGITIFKTIPIKNPTKITHRNTISVVVKIGKTVQK